jgi:hypothetical protein
MAQTPPSARAIEARRLHDVEGLGYKRIGKRLGVSRDRARDLVRTPTRAAARQRTDRGRQHRRAGPCPGCGGVRYATGDSLCITCNAEASDYVKEVVEALWNEGYSMRAILTLTGYASIKALGSAMHRMRGEGYDLPLYHRA